MIVTWLRAVWWLTSLENNGETTYRAWVFFLCRYKLYALEKSTVEGVEVQECDEEDDNAVERLERSASFLWDKSHT